MAQGLFTGLAWDFRTKGQGDAARNYWAGLTKPDRPHARRKPVVYLKWVEPSAALEGGGWQGVCPHGKPVTGIFPYAEQAKAKAQAELWFEKQLAAYGLTVQP